MKKKQVLAVSSALMIGTTTALTGLPTPVMAQENTEVVQEAVVEENKTEQVPVEQKTENAEVQENITDKEQEETAENAETLKEESTKQETPATPEKEVVTEDKTVEASKNTEVKAGSIAIDETHFPDKVFREQIIAEFDKDGDSVLSVDEISKAQFLNLHGMKTISSLEGIQYLTNLQSLDVSTTSVSDLSPVKKLIFMEEVLIDDNMVFDIDNLKGFLNDTSSFGFIAKENNKIIGFAYCYTLLRPDGKTMFYLHSIGMLPNYQDKGYGSKLLSFIKEYSKEIGCSEMFLITDKGNPRACHVYEKLGGKNDYKDEIVYVYDYEKGDK